MAEDIVVETRPLRLAAKVWGPEDGVKVLALHGWMDNAASFDRLAPLLPGVRTVALDLPGHGRSDHRPAGTAYHFVDWVADVLAAADALGWSRFALVGHSMGAGISSLVPGVAPERIDRVVLIEGVGPLSRPAAKAPEELTEALAEERARAGAPVRVFPHLEAAITARAMRSDLDRTAAAVLVERGTVRVEGGLRFTHDPRLGLPSRLRFTEKQVHAFLEAMACPVLGIRASGGLPLPEEIVERRLAAIPHLTQHQVDGGHHAHLTHPEGVAAVVAPFLAAARTG